MRSISNLLLLAVVSTACVPAARTPTTDAAAKIAPEPTRGDAVAAAHRCGVALGLAARCDLLRDDRDYAVLRFSMIQGLGRKFPTRASPADLTEILDLASLDRIGAVGQCEVPAAEAPRLTTGVRSIVEQCVAP